MARIRMPIVGREAENAATVELLDGDSFGGRFAMFEREEEIAALLRSSHF